MRALDLKGYILQTANSPPKFLHKADTIDVTSETSTLVENPNHKF